MVSRLAGTGEGGGPLTAAGRLAGTGHHTERLGPDGHTAGLSTVERRAQLAEAFEGRDQCCRPGFWEGGATGGA